MKQQTTMKLLAGCIAVVTVLGLALTAMGCKDSDDTTPQDLVITYKNIKIIIDAGSLSNFPQSEVDTLLEYVEIVRDYEEFKAYLDSKDEFKIYVKPLAEPQAPGRRYKIVNDKEIIISNDVINAHMLVGAIESALTHIIILYPLANIKQFNNAIKPSGSATVPATNFS